MYLVREGSTSSGYSGRESLDAALDELEHVYSFVLARVGNRPDAEDLVQQVALKALPRLRQGACDGEVRAYLFATARSVLSTFWAHRYRLPQSELADDIAGDERGAAPTASAEACEWLEQTLAALPVHYRQVLELRFMRGCSIREAAREMGKSEGAIKLLQLRALRAAACLPSRPSPTRREHRPPSAARGFACEPRPGTPTV